MLTPSKEFNSKDKGDIGEAILLAEFTKLNIQVSKPFGDNARYDLIIDVNNILYKVQVKYCNQKTKNNSIIVPCCSSKNHTTNKKRDTYENDVDFIACYLEYYNTCCLIPISIIGKQKSISLREFPTKNSKKYFLIKDFAIEKILCVETLHDASK